MRSDIQKVMDYLENLETHLDESSGGGGTIKSKYVRNWINELKEIAKPSDTSELIKFKLRLFMDGDSWCAVFDSNFINLQESSAGFGDTPLEAVSDLYANDRKE